MIRCLAVDDEAYAIKMMADYIARVPYLQLAGTTTNAIEALQMIESGEIDLVFLDIQMPELTGIQFLKICGSKCKAILTTAYAEYALDGFEHDVIDYLLKPIAFDRFLKATQKAYTYFNSVKNANPQLPAPTVTNPVAGHTDKPYLFIKGDSKNKFIKINHDDILYIEGLKNYVSVYTSLQQRLVTYQSLSHLAEELPRPPFYRVHRSYIVSMTNVRMVDGNTLYIGEKAIPIGETYKDGFFKLLGEK